MDTKFRERWQSVREPVVSHPAKSYLMHALSVLLFLFYLAPYTALLVFRCKETRDFRLVTWSGSNYNRTVGCQIDGSRVSRELKGYKTVPERVIG
jgi:hypothetical protein